MRKIIRNFGYESLVSGFVNDPSGDIPLFTPSGQRNPVKINDEGEVEPMYSYEKSESQKHTE